MSVFISHSSKDKPAVEALALGLRERGIEVWLDKWQIGPGDDIVASINAGLDEAGCGIIVFSAACREHRWVEAEVSYLTYARIKEGKALIPILLGEDAFVPALLRPLAWRSIAEVDAIADAVLGRKVGPPTVRAAEHGRTERVLITLRKVGDAGVEVVVRIGGETHGEATHPALSRDLVQGQEAFLRGVRHGVRRDASAVDRRSMEAGLADLGRALSALCLPGDAGAALTGLIDGALLGTTVEVCFEADDRGLLGLPFEALRLPDDRLLATWSNVVMLRRPLGLSATDTPGLAGPLKILIAVGAPDENLTGSAVLDQERELQTILDAVEPAQRLENIEVRILEVGHPEAIGAAFKADAYHVLHLSCHGSPGVLELEDEDGSPVAVTAKDLIRPMREAGRPLPLVLLNACHGGVQAGQTASLAEALLGAGVPGVLAMQTSVSDAYASRLAGAFYQHLSRREMLLASRALADARRELEDERRKAVVAGAPLAETQPEYATATLYVRGDEHRLADFSLDKRPLTVRPVYDVAGPVPQLGMDDLIGRRLELRQTLRTLRDAGRRHAGVVLTGIGGVGKSAVAGRAMTRLIEEGWLVPAHVGPFDIAAIAAAVGLALLTAGNKAQQEANLLLRADQDDQTRVRLIAQALGQRRMVLVLDDFEQNLRTGGGDFENSDVAVWLGLLAQSARAGRLLITSRYPVPGMDHVFRHIDIGPLSHAESRKLLLRLPALKGRDAGNLARIIQVIGGHPRMLEFLDGLLRGGEGRLPHVTEKLREVARKAGVTLDGRPIDDLNEGVRTAILLGVGNVLLQELLALAQEGGADEALLQLAVSNLPMTPAGLARALAGDEAAGDEPAVHRALCRLEEMSLVHRFGDGTLWVHRWTAQGLADQSDAVQHRTRCLRAGRYRWWRVRNETHDLGDAIEAVRNFLAGRHFDEAVGVGQVCLDAMRRFQQTLSVTALAGEILERLPEDHPGWVNIVDKEAEAHLALGFTEQALGRQRALLRRFERLAAAEPDRADYQRDLSVSYIKMGDLYRALGQGEEARRAYAQSLAIRERLAAAEPDRADYQRDLSVSHIKMGDLYRALGQGEEARRAYAQSLAIAERLAAAEPDRADYQRDLSVSYDRMGDLYRALGQGEEARQCYEKDLAIAERLAAAEPDRADYQRDLSVSYIKMGDLYRALGQGEEARRAYAQSLAIRERLAAAEPDRADYQRDLSVSYERMGDLYRALGQGEEARRACAQSLAIRERLAAAEPDRADYQRDLSVSYIKMGDLYRALGQGEEARRAYAQSLAIAERLAAAEPDRADYQRDLVVSLVRLSEMATNADASHALSRALGIVEDLAAGGRLAPADAWMMDDLRKRLDDNGAES